jgi:hypothetical protein
MTTTESIIVESPKEVSSAPSAQDLIFLLVMVGVIYVILG